MPLTSVPEVEAMKTRFQSPGNKQKADEVEVDRPAKIQ